MDPGQPREMPKHQGEDTDLSIGYGTRLDKLDEPLILYPARSRAFDAFNERVKFLWIPALLFYGLGTYLNPDKLWLAIACITWLLLTYICARRFYLLSLLPILEMRSDGLSIHSFAIKLFIPWSEIKEVQSYEFGYRYIGIVPINLGKTLTRVTLGTKYYVWVSALAMPLCRFFGVFAAPINILESELPLSADDVADQINLRRAYALGQGSSIEPGE